MRNLLLVLFAAVSVPALAETSCEHSPSVLTDETLRLVSLNAAHGRGLGKNQMLQSGDTARENLGRVADLLTELDADVVALQEADGESRWSGGFDHVQLLADGAGYPCTVHGLHAVKRMYSFGTAILSRHQFVGTLAHDFEPSWPTTTKGFTLATVLWNPGNKLEEPLRLNLMSVHLDFSRKSVREAQIAEMTVALEGYEHPVVIMGDFNSDWETDGSALQKIAAEGELTAWQPEAEGQGTYKGGDKRLDWILISKDLEFVDYFPSTKDVSDHRAVVAKIRIIDQ